MKGRMAFKNRFTKLVLLCPMMKVRMNEEGVNDVMVKKKIYISILLNKITAATSLLIRSKNKHKINIELVQTYNNMNSKFTN